jgi:hypothetical protein
LFGEVLGFLFVYPGLVTLARVHESENAEFVDIELREKGSPDIPFIRADINYQRVSSKIDGFDGRLLAGYGPIGIQYRHTHYIEENPNNSLNLIQMHGLYRISWSEKFELGLGFGGTILDGNSQSGGFSMTYPISYFPFKSIGLNFTPTWSWIHGNMVSDYDESITYVHKFISVRLGYRRNRVGDEILEGPCFGVTYHY